MFTILLKRYMNKTDKIIELKKLLDSGLISQSDFDRLKKQIFEGGKNVSNEFNKISQSEFNENIQQKRANDSSKFDESIKRTKINASSDTDKTKRCPQCGSDNAIENSDCEVCKTDFSSQGNKNENYVEIEHESNNSKYLMFGILVVLLIVIGAVYFSNSNKSNNNQESNIQVKDSISPSVSLTDTTSIVNQDCADCPPSDTLNTFKNDTTSIDENLNNNEQNIEYYGDNDNSQDNDNRIFNSSEIEVKPDFPGGIGAFYKFISNNFTVPEVEGLKGIVTVSFIIEKDGRLTDIKVLKNVGYGTYEEALRVLKKSPRWIPGKQYGNAVRVSYTMDIKVEVPQ